ncbi:MAG: ATP-binding protein [Clostridia bacterium]|nr:ATP-binding protein [Clostridia bacterium]
MAEKNVKATVDRLEEIAAFTEETLEAYGVPLKVQSQVAVAVDEIFTNIASYAYPGGEGDASLAIGMDEAKGILTLTFTDSGIPYNPLEKEDPDITLSAEERHIGGLGIFMVKKLMDGMTYVRENGKNILTMEKRTTTC